MVTTEKDWYTIRELAAEIDRSSKTIWRWIKDGKLKSQRYGATHRIAKSDWQLAFANFNDATTTTK